MTEEDHKHYLRIYGEDYKTNYTWRKKHGDLKNLNLRYCNACGFETRWDEDGCEFHQRVIHDEEGSHLKYEEFNQDGEEW